MNKFIGCPLYHGSVFPGFSISIKSFKVICWRIAPVYVTNSHALKDNLFCLVKLGFISFAIIFPQHLLLCSGEFSILFLEPVFWLAEALVENFSKLDSILDFITLWLWTNDDDKIEFRDSNSGCYSNSVWFRKNSQYSHSDWFIGSHAWLDFLKPTKFVSLSAISKTDITAIDIWVRTRIELSPGISGPHEPIFEILISDPGWPSSDS